MASTAARRSGRPHHRVLSRELIVDMALKLLDRHGADGFGMRELASALDVRVSSLYNHVSGKDDVIAGIREYIGTHLDDSVFDTEPWDQALTEWARAYRHTFAAHPPTIALLAVLPLAPDSTLAQTYDKLISMLEREGFESARALDIVVALEDLILGAALDAAAAPDMLNPGPRADVPRFSNAYATRLARSERTGSTPAESAFEVGLALFVNGLRAEKGAT